MATKPIRFKAPTKIADLTGTQQAAFIRSLQKIFETLHEQELLRPARTWQKEVKAHLAGENGESGMRITLEAKPTTAARADDITAIVLAPYAKSATTPWLVVERGEGIVDQATTATFNMALIQEMVKSMPALNV